MNMNIFNSFELLFPIFGGLLQDADCIYLVGVTRDSVWFDEIHVCLGLLYVSLFIVPAGLEPAASV